MRKALGQHFLIDELVLQQMVNQIGVTNDHPWLEIGPGDGALTKHLLHRGAHLTAIEYDKRMVGVLRQRYGGNRCTIHHGDACAFDYATIAQGSRVVGNLPYNVASQIMLKLLPYQRWHDMHFLLQKEMAERLCAIINSKQYGRFTLMCGYWATCTALLDVSASAFRPPPKVESTFIHLLPHSRFEPQYYPYFAILVQHGFGQRRKKIANALANLVDQTALHHADIEPSQRAENIAIEQWYALAAYQGNLQ